MKSYTGTKTIFDVLYVLDIDQNLLNVGHLIQKSFKVIFEDQFYHIKDAAGQELFKIQTRGKKLHS